MILVPYLFQLLLGRTFIHVHLKIYFLTKIPKFYSYYAGKGHRPRWVSLGMYTIAMFCFLNALPHLLYGPGEQALSLTREYGATEEHSKSFEYKEMEKQKTMCRPNG